MTVEGGARDRDNHDAGASACADPRIAERHLAAITEMIVLQWGRFNQPCVAALPVAGDRIRV